MQPIEGGYFCNVPQDVLEEAGAQCKWPMAEISLFQDIQLPGLTAVEIQRVWQQCCELWNGVGRLPLHMAPSAGHANILSLAGRIDGPNGVLGQSYLPCGNVGRTSQLGQLYDNGERWNLGFLQRVALHEIGHALGLGHAPRGSGAVMEPILTNFTVPQQWDAREIDSRYPGGPIVIPPADPGPDPANQFAVRGNVVIEGVPYILAATATRRLITR
jgi:hypothetical protein